MIIIKGSEIIVEPMMIKLSGDVIWFMYGGKSNYYFSYPTETEASEDYAEIKQAIKEDCDWVDLEVIAQKKIERIEWEKRKEKEWQEE